MAAIHLSEYLETVTRRRIDCCVLMADWLVANGFPDPMADRRGTYSTKREYLRMLRSEGGLLASCLKRFSGIGLSETSDPGCGDLAVVIAPIWIKGGRPVTGQTGAICLSKTMRAVIASDASLAGAELLTIRAWKIHG